MKKIDGFDDCVVGIVERCTQPPILCYDIDKICNKLIKSHGMDASEALEHFDTNIKGAWVGNDTPCFLWKDKWAYENIEDFCDVVEDNE